MMLNRTIRWAIALVLLLLIPLAARTAAQPGPDEPTAPQMSSANYRLNWYVIANGGVNESSAHYKLSGTVGQTGVATIGSAHVKACSGFWCAIGKWLINLPILFKT